MPCKIEYRQQYNNEIRRRKSLNSRQRKIIISIYREISPIELNALNRIKYRYTIPNVSFDEHFKILFYPYC